MIKHQIDTYSDRFELSESPELSPIFWLMQGTFWFALALATFLTLTLWYGTAELSHIAHTLAQAAVGFVIAIPLHYIYTTFWEDRWLVRCAVGFVSVVLFAAFWTAARLQLFILMTPEGPEVWADYGGWYFSGLFIFLGWTAIYHGIFYYQQALFDRESSRLAVERSRADKVKRLEAEKVAGEAKLRMLRYQLNPHFLFNTLNAISALIELKEPETASAMVQKLSQFLRYSLEEEQVKNIQLTRELEALRLYLGIEETRFSDRLSVEFEIEKATENALVPSLILQPLVENALKFAIAVQEQGGKLTVSSRLDGNILTLSVQDTGPGIDGFVSGQIIPVENFHGVGLMNANARLQSLYGSDYSMEISNLETGGLLVELAIPYELA